MINAIAKRKNVDAIHPGYGFLSENPEFVRKCEENGIVFIGPSAEIMNMMGDKINSKKSSAVLSKIFLVFSYSTLTPPTSRPNP